LIWQWKEAVGKLRRRLVVLQEENKRLRGILDSMIPHSTWLLKKSMRLREAEEKRLQEIDRWRKGKKDEKEEVKMSPMWKKDTERPEEEMIGKDRVKKAAAFCGISIIDHKKAEALYRYCGHIPLASFNTITGELIYAPELEDSEEVQCFKRTLASEPEGEGEDE